MAATGVIAATQPPASLIILAILVLLTQCCTGMFEYDASGMQTDTTASAKSGVRITHGLAATTSAQHVEGRQFNPGWVHESGEVHLCCCLILFVNKKNKCD